MRLAHIFAARQRIAPFVRRTPLAPSPWLSSLAGASVRLKLESLQITNSFKARGAVNVEVKPTIADGLAGNIDPETITFDYVRKYVDRLALAPEHAIKDAVRHLATHEHLIAEGAGATAVAALSNGWRPKTGHVAVVLSGSNIDPGRLASLLGRDTAPGQDP